MRIFPCFEEKISAFLIILATSSLCFGQCSNQPPPNPWSVPPNTTVYYSFDPSLQNIPPGTSSPSATGQITNAFNAWTTANSSAGGSGTIFAPADSFHPATVIVSADGATDQGAATTSAYAGLINSSNPATMVFHPNAFISGTSTNGFQVTAPGYNDAYMQSALHEVGHLMGMNDYNTPPSPGPQTSVMIPFIGVNDQGNTYPKNGPTDCDKQQAKSVTTAIAAAASSGGGGGSGSPHTGGGGCPNPLENCGSGGSKPESESPVTD